MDTYHLYVIAINLCIVSQAGWTALNWANSKGRVDVAQALKTGNA